MRPHPAEVAAPDSARHARPPRRGLRAALIAGIVVVLAAGAAGAYVLLRPEQPTAAARRWLAAWERGDHQGMQRLLAQPQPGLPAAYTQVDRSLGIEHASYEPGQAHGEGKRATVDFSARAELRGLGTWSWMGRLELTRSGRHWLVAWTPAAILTLTRQRTWPARAPILARDGTPLVRTSEIVVVGVQPGRVRDRAALLEALERDAGADPAQVAKKLDDPTVKPDWFVPVAELRKAEYDKVRPRLYPVPGTVFRSASGRVAGPAAPTQVVGEVREASADDLRRLGAGYEAGDRVGVSGLERAREADLAGRPDGAVVLVGKDGRPQAVLARFPGKRPEPLRTTIDPHTQAAAATALARVNRPAALVALHAATGQVRAVVNRPADQPFNRAFSGRYPPGSTFKVITTTALLEAGRRPDDLVDCPATTVVDGREFKNFEGGRLGRVTFREVFADSCNTAFVRLAGRLPATALADAAAGFGFDLDYQVEPPASEGSFPEPGGATALAAAALGQGQVTASPLHMASVAAAVASGAWRAPHLVDGVASPVEPRRLKPATVRELRSLMGSVVSDGTGKQAAVPGRRVAGKTGTAEFGDDDPPRTHAWFIGYSGELAFAVIVEGGGVGGRVAAPLAARFLAAL
jgi:cell division protein FtsI/penicillin-binding protein 2